MKVLHVIPSVSMKHGGPSHVIRSMTEDLAKDGIDVTVATTTAEISEELDVPVGEFRMENGVRYIYFPSQTPKQWTFSWPLTQWLFQSVKNYDLVHIHAVFSYPTLAACKASRKAGVPYLLFPAGMLDPYSLNIYSWKKWPYYYLLERSNLKFAAAIQVASEMECGSLEQLGFYRKIHIVPHAIDLPNITEHDLKHSRKEPLEILFMSRLHPKKAIPVLFEAVTLLGAEKFKFRLTVAGCGEPGYEGMLKKMVQFLGISTFVRFVGHVEGDTKKELFLRSDIFVLPSYHENFGIVVAEAMAYGLPVILSNQVALAEEVTQKDAGVVVSIDDPKSLAKAIIGFDDKERLKEAGRNAKRHAIECFNPLNQLRLIMLLYKNILAKD